MNRKNEVKIFPTSVFIERSLERVGRLLMESEGGDGPNDPENRSQRSVSGVSGGVKGDSSVGEKNTSDIPPVEREEVGTQVGVKRRGEYKPEESPQVDPELLQRAMNARKARGEEEEVKDFKKKPLHSEAQKWSFEKVDGKMDRIVIDEEVLPIFVRLLGNRNVTVRDRAEGTYNTGPKTQEVEAQLKIVENFLLKSMEGLILNKKKLQFYDEEKLTRAFNSSKKTFDFPDNLSKKYRHFGLYVMPENSTVFGYFIPLKGGQAILESASPQIHGTKETTLMKIFNSFSGNYYNLRDIVLYSAKNMITKIKNNEYGGDEFVKKIAIEVVKLFATYIVNYLPNKDESAIEVFVHFLYENRYMNIDSKSNKGDILLRKGVRWFGNPWGIIEFEPYLNIDSDFSTNITVRTLNKGEVYLSSYVNQDLEIEVYDKGVKGPVSTKAKNIAIALTNIYNTYMVDKIHRFLKGDKEKVQYRFNSLYSSFSGLSSLVADRVEKFGRRVSPCLYFGPLESTGDKFSAYLTSVSKYVGGPETNDEDSSISGMEYRHIFNVLVHSDIINNNKNTQHSDFLVSLDLLLKQIEQWKYYLSVIEKEKNQGEERFYLTALEYLAKMFSVEISSEGDGEQTLFYDFDEFSSIFKEDKKSVLQKMASFFKKNNGNGQEATNVYRVVKELDNFHKTINPQYGKFRKGYRVIVSDSLSVINDLKVGLEKLFPFYRDDGLVNTDVEAMIPTGVRKVGDSGDVSSSDSGNETPPEQRESGSKNVVKESKVMKKKKKIFEEEKAGEQNASGSGSGPSNGSSLAQAGGKPMHPIALQANKAAEFVSLFTYAYHTVLPIDKPDAELYSVAYRASESFKALVKRKSFESFREMVQKDPTIPRWKNPKMPSLMPAPFPVPTAYNLINTAFGVSSSGERYWIYEAYRLSTLKEKLLGTMSGLVNGTFVYISDVTELGQMLDFVYNNAEESIQRFLKNFKAMGKIAQKFYDQVKDLDTSNLSVSVVKPGELVSYERGRMRKIVILDKKQFGGLIKRFTLIDRSS